MLFLFYTISATGPETKPDISLISQQRNEYIDGALSCIRKHLNIYKAFEFEFTQKSLFAKESNNEMKKMEAMYKEAYGKKQDFKEIHKAYLMFTETIEKRKELKIKTNELLKKIYSSLDEIEIENLELYNPTQSNEYKAIIKFRFTLQKFKKFLFDPNDWNDVNYKLLRKEGCLDMENYSTVFFYLWLEKKEFKQFSCIKKQYLKLEAFLRELEMEKSFTVSLKLVQEQ